MRMRKLGSEHSVAFFASREIWKKIASCVNKTSTNTLDSNDVLLWAIRQTCSQIVKDGALWASQGENFDRRSRAWERHKDGVYTQSEYTQSELASVFLEPESRTLEELYGVRYEEGLPSREGLSIIRSEIYDKCKALGFQPDRSSALSEEQERELSHEKEEERQVERARGAKPLKHSLDPALVTLVQSGQYPTSPEHIPLSSCLTQTSQASQLSQLSGSFFLSPQLRATKDFSKTIVLSQTEHIDHFLRPVQWILSTASSDILLLLSPFEANELLPRIRSSPYASLHIYSSRTSRSMRPLEGLSFFTVSPRMDFTLPHQRIIHELNLFAGQLFFNDWRTFEDVCNMLGLHLAKIPDHLQGKVDVVGFIEDEDERRRLGTLFSSNPVYFLRDLVGWRRKGQGFTLTHVGFMLHGNNLGDDEFSDVEV